MGKQTAAKMVKRQTQGVYHRQGKHGTASKDARTGEQAQSVCKKSYGQETKEGGAGTMQNRRQDHYPVAGDCPSATGKHG